MPLPPPTETAAVVRHWLIATTVGAITSAGTARVPGTLAARTVVVLPEASWTVMAAPGSATHTPRGWMAKEPPLKPTNSRVMRNGAPIVETE